MKFEWDVSLERYNFFFNIDTTISIVNNFVDISTMFWCKYILFINIAIFYKNLLVQVFLKTQF